MATTVASAAAALERESDYIDSDAETLIATPKRVKKSSSQRGHSSELSEPPPSSVSKDLPESSPVHAGTKRKLGGRVVSSPSTDSKAATAMHGRDSSSTSPSPFTSRGRSKRSKSDRDKAGQTKLHKAAAKDRLKEARSLVINGADVNESDNAGWAPIHEAAIKGHAEMVAFLLENGAKVDARGLDDDTPLLEATENGHIQVVKILLDHGADPRQHNVRGETPRDVLQSDDEQMRTTIEEALIKVRDTKRPSLDEGTRDHISHTRSESVEDINTNELIKKRGARGQPTRNELLWIDGTKSKTARDQLVHFARNGELQQLSHLVLSGTPCDIDAIVAASKYGHTECVEVLLGLGGDVNGVDEDGNTPLLAAAGRGNPEVVQALLRAGANPLTRNMEGQTCVELARKDLASDAIEVVMLQEAIQAAVENDKSTADTSSQLQDTKLRRVRRLRDVERPTKLDSQNVSKAAKASKVLPQRDAVKDMAKLSSKPIKLTENNAQNGIKTRKRRPGLDPSVSAEDRIFVDEQTVVSHDYHKVEAQNGEGCIKDEVETFSNPIHENDRGNGSFEVPLPSRPLEAAICYSQLFTAVLPADVTSDNANWRQRTLWVLDHQVGLFLGVTDLLKRRYPFLDRRKLSLHEKSLVWEFVSPASRLLVDPLLDSGVLPAAIDTVIELRDHERELFNAAEISWIKVC